MPFAPQRVPATELATTPLPAKHILLIENERSLHQLPQPLPDTIAILGAGLNLGWLAAPWLQSRQVAYWGDIDTWGLAMLATARSHLPHLHPLLMDRHHLRCPRPPGRGRTRTRQPRTVRRVDARRNRAGSAPAPANTRAAGTGVCAH